MSDYLAKAIVSIVFEDDLDKVKHWFTKFGVTLTDEDGTTIATSKNHNMKIGFNWNTLDVYTRAHQINFALFGGFHFVPTTDLIDLEFKNRKKASRK